MVTMYTGNGAYCYANSLHMSLCIVGMADLPEPGFLECLTAMPFGKMNIRGGEMPFFYPNGTQSDPDNGLTLALKMLGWESDEQFGGTDAEALERLRVAVKQAPVLVGALDMGLLKYNPEFESLGGADHFVLVLEVGAETVRIHDPAGYPYAYLPIPDFMEAWRAKAITYGRTPFMMRSGFRQVECFSRAEMITRALPHIRANVTANPGGPIIFGGDEALRLLADDLRAEVSPNLRAHLIYFALPLATRRLNDAALFLSEAGLPDAASCALEQSRLFGEMLYPAVHKQWERVILLLEQAAEVERRFAQAIA
jgi:hypothetical protein